MLIASEVSVMQRPSRSSRQGLTRVAITALGTVGMLLASTHASRAQTSAPQERTLELRITGGAFVPTGNQRTSLGNAHVTAAQMSWVVRPSLAITGTVGWARSRDLISATSPKLDVFTSDLGVEARPAQWFAGRAITFSPFAGLGAGARSYNCRKLDVDATNNLAGYGSVGGELGVGRMGVRLEVRDYMTGFKPLVGGGKSDMRNDVVMMVGLRFNRNSASRQ
jgi:hypothetical protein